MKLKWTGANPITIRSETFEPSKARDIEDEALFNKCRNIPGFEEVKRGRKKSDDENLK